MKTVLLKLFASVLFLFGGPFASPAQSSADAHWQLSAIYSNTDGAVQYIEMTSLGADQGRLKNQTLKSYSSGSVDNFIFNENLIGETAGMSLLLATSGFYKLTGLQPDYIIPDRFISVAGGRLEFANGVDSFEFIKQKLPLNGSQALSRSGEPTLARATNFSGQSATVFDNSWAAYDEQLGELKLPVLKVSDALIANVTFTVDLAASTFTLLDNFYFYGTGISSGATPASLENNAAVYIPALVIGKQLFELKLWIIGDNPVVLGNPTVLSVRALLPDEGGAFPHSAAMESSIMRGKILYAQQCENCHGSDSAGGIAAAIIFRANPIDFAELREFVDERMPFQNPALCKDTAADTCASDVANYAISAIRQLEK